MGHFTPPEFCHFKTSLPDVLAAGLNVDTTAAAASTLNPMSRGLGHIEHSILAMVERARRRRGRIAFTAWDIAYEAFPRKRPSHAQQVAVLRAMHTFVGKHPGYGLIQGRGINPL
jgi:hypothetical protein